MLQTNPGSTPVGTVLMYAGTTEGSSVYNLFMAGWALCDGSTFPFSQFPDLFNVIGQSYGGTPGYFAVPTYQGLFIRGVDGTAGRDKESAQRIAPRKDLANAGNSGNNVGSLQMDELGSHTHNYKYYNNYQESSHTLGNESLSGSGDNTMDTVGGAETRPVNQYINFIIKAVASPDIVPLGAVVPYAGEIADAASSLLAAGWLPCVGNNQKVSDYSMLYQVISSFYGAEDQNSFRVPDFRGQFIRGVQGQLAPSRPAMDPDYLIRTAPQPKLALQGNTGNLPGSVQSSLFAAHAHNYTYNNDYWNTAATLIGWKAEANKGQTWTSDANSGALTETRPDNINVNYLIKAL